MADKKLITLKNGKYGVNGKRVFGYKYRSTTDGNWYQINSDGTRTFLRYADDTQNYDRFPVGSYIRTIENADRAEKHKEYWKNNLKLGGIIKKKRFDK